MIGKRDRYREKEQKEKKNVEILKRGGKYVHWLLFPVGRRACRVVPSRLLVLALTSTVAVYIYIYIYILNERAHMINTYLRSVCYVTIYNYN